MSPVSPVSNDIVQLLSILEQAYSRRSWHGTNLRGAIGRTSLGQAVWRPGASRHNIWEILVHVAYWKYIAWRRLTGADRGSFPLKGSNWFRRPPMSLDSFDRVWRADIALLDQAHRTLCDAVATLSAADLRKTPRGSHVSRFDLLSGVAAHDLYHAGQIQLLKKLGGAR